MPAKNGELGFSMNTQQMKIHTFPRCHNIAIPASHTWDHHYPPSVAACWRMSLCTRRCRWPWEVVVKLSTIKLRGFHIGALRCPINSQATKEKKKERKRKSVTWTREIVNYIRWTRGLLLSLSPILPSIILPCKKVRDCSGTHRRYIKHKNPTHQ